MATLARRQPFGEFADLHDRLDRLFERMTDGGERAFAPAIDVIRKEDRIVVKADVPGIKPEEMKIKAEGGMLEVSGEHEESTEEKKEDYVRRERSYGSFMRTLALPEGVEPDQIEASTSDGVLEITIPLPAESRKKAVEIKPKAGD